MPPDAFAGQMQLASAPGSLVERDSAGDQCSPGHIQKEKASHSRGDDSQAYLVALLPTAMVDSLYVLHCSPASTPPPCLSPRSSEGAGKTGFSFLPTNLWGRLCGKINLHPQTWVVVFSCNMEEVVLPAAPKDEFLVDDNLIQCLHDGLI